MYDFVKFLMTIKRIEMCFELRHWPNELEWLVNGYVMALLAM